MVLFVAVAMVVVGLIVEAASSALMVADLGTVVVASWVDYLVVDLDHSMT